MEIFERIKDLRKNHLKLSQTSFGEKLGVNRDTINNIENNRLSRPEQKLPLYRLICRTFNVNEDWLFSGKEPVFAESDTFHLDIFLQRYHATNLEKEIIKIYFELEPKTRKLVIEHFRNKLISAIITNPALLIPDTQESLESLQSSSETDNSKNVC